MYISFTFLLLLFVVLVMYYILPADRRWISLLLGSAAFYLILDLYGFPLLMFSVTVSYLGSIKIEELRDKDLPLQKRRMVLAGVIILSLCPLIFSRVYNFFSGSFLSEGELFSLLIPLGVSFYSLQIAAYLTDIHSGKTGACRDYLKYFLFITFFPQVVQGPIPRYDLMDELYKGHLFSEDNVIRGFQLITWGFFLKLVIADRAGIFVDEIFAGADDYAGIYVLTAGILYSIQLYTDFSACVCIAKGAAEMFGISLQDNFKRPYFADSVHDFWRRWHISLSAFLRDYIYIPLGGSRKGRIRKYINIMITFLVSGIWHGAGLHYLFWGFMHGVYQIAGDIIKPFRNRFINTIVTFFMVMAAWIVFRAESLSKGLKMILSVFVRIDPDSMAMGPLLLENFEMTDWVILSASLTILIIVSLLQERGVVIREKILSRPAPVRGAVYLGAIIVNILFGEYGEGFDAGGFIYAGF